MNIRTFIQYGSFKVSLFSLFLLFSQRLTAQTPQKLTPLSPSEQEAFLQIVPDKAPPQLAKNTHYVRSNEYFHHLYQPLLAKQPGGVYVGVGTDQNYLMAGWKRPEILILMDFDQMVVDVHRVYQVMFAHAKTKEEFLSLWKLKNPETKKGQAPQIKAWIVEEFGEKVASVDEKGEQTERKVCGPLCKRVLRAYQYARGLVSRRLQVVHDLHLQLNVPCFLTDDEQYQYLVSLFQNHRVFYFRGDLSQHGLSEIAKVLRKTNRTLDTLYVSNAELYFPYVTVGGQTSFFAEHVKSMPFSEKSLVFHTWATGDHGKYYAYFYQSAQEFVKQLMDPRSIRFQSASIAKKHVRFAQVYIAKKLSKLKKRPPFIIKQPRLLLSLDEPLPQ